MPALTGPTLALPALAVPDLSTFAWVLLVIAAFTVGISKTSLPGATILSVAIFAAILPAKQSTGALLLLLIVADVFAVLTYRRHANWPVLLRLAPAVLVGVLLGVAFLAFAPDQWVKRFIGVILLVLIAITLFRRRVQAQVLDGGPHRVAAATYGTLGGFTTMVANAGGPVMSMYFLASRLQVKEFLGTAAWFFALVNLTKLPFSIGLGLITGPELLLDLVLVPAVVGGALIGRWLANRLNQALFDRLVIGLTIVGAIYLLF
ncbi:sulfite exporter TauE/SafE family protein [uncultured Microbacterium sp.]|uniref:sulfite exporter TauE/SafE family protein n=1 Tax=uncultured Microbacterium sp. TaxID=191216 RepID=UPI0035CA8B5D